jgi:hypothetical protein
LRGVGPESGEIYLTITPRVLASALAEIINVVLTPEEASARFVDAVSTMYRDLVLPQGRDLRVLRRYGHDGLPDCAAFLALSVLAAYKMHTDEGTAATAYYKRLAELLRCGLSGGMPRGFDADEFEALWYFLRAWFEREHRMSIAMPGPDAGLRRYVALPLTHVPLREVDIERLPDFFDWAGYEPGEQVAIERINADLVQWTRARRPFTVSGMEAIADDRRPAVLAQIAHELECWDGSQTDASGTRSAPVELFLHWERRVPILSYLPRRPAAFPAVFNDGVHVFDAGQEGWYEPVPVDAGCGNELRNGFLWTAASDGRRMALRRRGAEAIAMAPSEFDGPVSSRCLLLGATGAVLCSDSVLERVLQHLDRVTNTRCAPARSANVPAGWNLITGVCPVRRMPSPDGLEALDVADDVEIIPTGGLRLGRRWAWLSEAPPTLVVTGSRSAEQVKIDGDAVEVVQDGRIQDRGRLAQPGLHIVEVGRVRRKLEIVEAEIPPAMVHDPTSMSDSPRSHTVALPPGIWTVIGARPGEVAHTASGQWGAGSLVSCSFEPVWALCISTGPGAVIRCLAEYPPAPNGQARRLPMPQRRAALAWANAVFDANIRRPTVVSGYGTGLDDRAGAAWVEYVNAARRIKRVFKSGRR